MYRVAHKNVPLYVCTYVCVCRCMCCCQSFVVSSKDDMSQLAAELYAVVCVECRDKSVDLVAVINDLLTDMHSKVCSVIVNALSDSPLTVFIADDLSTMHVLLCHHVA